jgi:hypothetical protein
VELIIKAGLLADTQLIEAKKRSLTVEMQQKLPKIIAV